MLMMGVSNRAMALKALDQRMATSSKPSSSAQPSTSQTPSPRMATVASMGGQPLASGSGSAGETIEMQEGGDLGKGKEKE